MALHPKNRYGLMHNPESKTHLKRKLYIEHPYDILAYHASVSKYRFTDRSREVPGWEIIDVYVPDVGSITLWHKFTANCAYAESKDDYPVDAYQESMKFWKSIKIAVSDKPGRKRLGNYGTRLGTVSVTELEKFRREQDA
jgi:hypothetical protein